MRRPSLVALLVPTLAFPGLAFADSFTVGGGSGFDFANVPDAIRAANATGVPCDITIDSATYVYSPGLPTPKITVPLAIASTDGALGTDPIGSLWSVQPLTLTGIHVEVDMVENIPDYGTGYASPITLRRNGNTQGNSADLLATDIILTHQCPSSNEASVAGGGGCESWQGSAVSVRSGYVDVDGFDIRGFFYGSAFELLGDDVEFDIVQGVVAATGTNTGQAAGIYAPGLLRGNLHAVAFTNVGTLESSAIYLEGGTLDVDACLFEGGEGGSIHVSTRRAAVVHSTFSTYRARDSHRRGQIFVEGWEYSSHYTSGVYQWPVTLHVSNDLFEDNTGDYGPADIQIDNEKTTVFVADTTVTNPRAYGDHQGGSFAGDGDWTLERVAFQGDGDQQASGGGAIAFAGSSLVVKDSTFDGFNTAFGGAVSILGGESAFQTTFASFLGGSFTNNSAYFAGGSLIATGNVDLRIAGTRFASSWAGLGGAIGLGTALDTYGYGQLAPQYVVLSDVVIEDTEAGFGGAIYAAGKASRIRIEDSAFTDNRSLFGMFQGLDGAEGFISGGSGGVIASQLPLGELKVLRSTFTDSYADRYGGVLFSASEALRTDDGPVPNRFGEGAPGSTGHLSTVCDIANSPYNDEGLDIAFGSSIDIDGITVTGAVARFASVGFLAPHDEARVVGSDFTGNASDQDATFLGYGVARLDLSCNTFCGNQVGGHGSAVYLFDPGLSQGGQHYLDYSIRNNSFVGNQDGGDGNVVGFNFCDDLDEDNNSGLRTTAISIGQVVDSGTAGPSAPRGQLAVWNNTFTGESEAPATRDIWGQSRDVRLSIGNNVFQAAGSAVDLESSYFVDGDYNLYDDVLVQADGDAALYLPGPHDLTATPQYFRFTPGQCANRLFLVPGTPGFDQGDPHVRDRDGSVSDIGAYGGPGACPQDLDRDGFDELVDCDDDERNIFPGANETPYDTIDQDCDGFDFCDADHDGYDSDYCPNGTDCDDANPNVHPGATDLYANGIDEDCSAHDFCDFDGDLFRATTCGGEDCNDNVGGIYPGAVETPYDGIDQDCSGADLCDLDRDGVNSDRGTCGGTDCNDADAFTYPGAPEIPYDTVDQDCDGDDWCDVDGDGFDSIRCGGDDCDDESAAIHPGATETHNNGVDEDCDGEDDCDADDDGVWNTACGGEDCDDTDGTISPLADEVPYDGIDQDCDGADVCDADGDGHDDPECGGDDCDDTDPGAYPGAPESPDDGVDQDCDGEDLFPLPPGSCSACQGSTTGSPPWSALGALGLGLVLLRRRRDPSGTVRAHGHSVRS